MRKTKILGFALLAGTAAVLTSDSANAQGEGHDTALAIEGERSFLTYCASCHGRGAKGDGPLAKDLKAPPANLTELSKRNDGAFPYEMVIDTIDHGRSVRGHGSKEMPAWGDAFKMTEKTDDAVKKKMEELAHFLWSRQVED